MTRLLLSAAALAALSTACGLPEGAIDLSSHGVDTWRGLSMQGDRLNLVAEGRGILEIDLDGELLSERKVGEQGLLDAAYRDLAVVDAGLGDAPKYVLLADDQGYLYDPLAQTETVHFCVLPGDVVGPLLEQKNDAVAVGGETILAAPRFYDVGTGALVSSELRSYALTDGAPQSTVSLSQPLELRGLAVTLDGVFGVSGGSVYRIDRDGSVGSEIAVPSLGSGAGIASDGERAFILDEDNDRIAVLPLSDL